MKYIIDAYNLFFHLEQDPHALEEKRENFIAGLNDILERLDLNVILIFDSHQSYASILPTTKNLSSLEIIFSPQGLSADDYIIEQLTTEKNPETQIIVTSDRELTRQIKQLGGKTKTIKIFLELLIERNTKKNSQKEKKIEKESSYHFDRLLKSFEKKLKDESSD